MKVLVSAAILLGLSEAYKVRRWQDMTMKKPISEERMDALLRKYEIVFGIGVNALSQTNSENEFMIKDKFQIDIQDRDAENSGIRKLQ